APPGFMCRQRGAPSPGITGGWFKKSGGCPLSPQTTRILAYFRRSDKTTIALHSGRIRATETAKTDCLRLSLATPGRGGTQTRLTSNKTTLKTPSQLCLPNYMQQLERSLRWY